MLPNILACSTCGKPEHAAQSRDVAQSVSRRFLPACDMQLGHTHKSVCQNMSHYYLKGNFSANDAQTCAKSTGTIQMSL